MFLVVLVVLLVFNTNCYGKSEEPCALKDHLIREIESNLVELKSLHVHTPEYGGHQGETYIRWGKSSCPQKATLVYDGYAAGNDDSIGGSGSNFLCLPKNPDWKEYTSGANTHTGRIFGVEYEILNHKPYPKSFHNQDMPCAVCLTARSMVLMVPGKLKCHKGWKKEFSGYLMSEMSTSTRTPSQYICVDEKLESVPGGAAGRNQCVVYPVEAVCGNLKCPPYVGGRELTCVVCSK
ncbi:Hypothetical predicted protein [Mytilus galloprovincialis]|uniref:Short-chain collagen C4-like n=1 Tax=Mytilus galloprovincialis TaxID=29158 RepID=A0A8B6HLA5_MYTGA|nr:Hypothetical predicted protein [Mytilus galloprovincialis]